MVTSEQIRVLCVRSGVSLSELARRIDQTPQNLQNMNNILFCQTEKRCNKYRKEGCYD